MKIIDLTKRFDDKTVFDNYSLELNDGAVTYIMGSSGIGKTTLL
ncbi:MAG: ATP-binding cassette domain-containing protein [Clostridia bacterium]|nr:ATP-binding cassette domain-containing protein [Clostridia bacterium]